MFIIILSSSWFCLTHNMIQRCRFSFCICMWTSRYTHFHFLFNVFIFCMHVCILLNLWSNTNIKFCILICRSVQEAWHWQEWVHWVNLKPGTDCHFSSLLFFVWHPSICLKHFYFFLSVADVCHDIKDQRILNSTFIMFVNPHDKHTVYAHALFVLWNNWKL